MEERVLSDAFWNELIQKDKRARSKACEEGRDVDPDDPAIAQQFEELAKVMDNKPIQREPLWRILELCREEQPVSVVEEAIAQYPEFPLVMQPPYRLVKYLIDGGGLVQREIDAAGNPISSEKKATLSRDELDDLVGSFTLQTTDAGRAMADAMAPLVRMKDVFQFYTDRAQLFIELLRFCCEPRTYADIEALITPEKIAGLKTYNYEPGSMMKPSVFVDNMERAAALVWRDHAWHATDHARAVLAALDEPSA